MSFKNHYGLINLKLIQDWLHSSCSLMVMCRFKQMLDAAGLSAKLAWRHVPRVAIHLKIVYCLLFLLMPAYSEGNSTGNHWFYHQTWMFPVNCCHQPTQDANVWGPAQMVPFLVQNCWPKRPFFFKKMDAYGFWFQSESMHDQFFCQAMGEMHWASQS